MRTLALALLLAGCGADRMQRLYDGDPRPPGDVATVRVFGARGGPGEAGDVFYDAWIVGIDGRTLERRTHHAEILPGKHVFAIKFKQFEVPEYSDRDPMADPAWQKTDTGVLKRELVAEAGKEYELAWIPTFQNFRRPEFRERGLGR